jgi:outer membrane protein assembly factor BamB
MLRRIVCSWWLSLCVAPFATAEWPDFLPQTRLAELPADLPLSWTSTSGIAWKADIRGDGQSSPVVWDDAVIVTSVDGDMKDENLITSFDLATGEKRWEKSFPSSFKVKSSLYVSRAAPTPIVDEDGIYVFFESGDLLALDWKGEAKWQRKLTSEYGEIKGEFGISGSLAQHGGSLFVLVENDGPSYLTAVNKADGKMIWKAERDSRISWSSPSVMTLAGVPQVVVSSTGFIDGYDVNTGERLWTLDGLAGNTVATPSQVDADRFIVGASPGRDGKDAGPAAESNLMVKVSSDAGKVNAAIKWRAEKAVGSFSTPIAHKGLGYWINRTGVVQCVDLKDGSAVYSERLDESAWATPIAVDDRIYSFGKDGVTTVFATGREFKKLGSNRLWDKDAMDASAAGDKEETAERRAAAAMFAGPIQYGVAVAGNRFLIRTGNRLYCVGGVEAPAK